MSDSPPSSSSDTADGSESSRRRGVLTQTDREYLRGDHEYDSRQAEYDRRKELRERVRHGLLDFSVLATEIDQDELETMMEEYEDDERVEESLKALIAFVYRLTAADYPLGAGFADENRRFESVLTDGLRRALYKYDTILDELKYRPRTTYVPGSEEARKMAAVNEDLSPEQIRRLMEEGAIDVDAVQEVVRNELLSDAGGPEADK